MGVTSKYGCKEVCIYFLILLLPTPIVSVLFCSSIPTFCSLKNIYMDDYWRLTAGVSIWRYGAKTKMSDTRIFLAPVRKNTAPEMIRVGPADQQCSKARPPYFTACVYTHLHCVNRKI